MTTDNAKPIMYARKEYGGFYTLRQERYRHLLDAGKEHKNDVCATARSLSELRKMCEKHWPDTSWDIEESA